MNNEKKVRLKRFKVQSVSWDQIIGPKGWIKIAILAALLIWVFWGEVTYVVRTWETDPNWSHGFIIPFFSLFFLNQRREQLLQAEKKFTWFNWLGLLIILGSIFVFMVSIYPLKMGYPRSLAFLTTLFGLVFFCCGWKVIRITWLPVLFLFFAIPIPARLYEALTIPMRIKVSEVAAACFNLIPSMDVISSGVTIDGMYKGEPFMLSIAEACSGMRLMMAFVALGVAMAYLSDRPYWHRLILVLTTVPIAIFCNFLRVIVTGLLYVFVDPMFAKGGFHTTLGLLMLPVAFILYWLIASLLNNIYENVEIEEQAS